MRPFFVLVLLAATPILAGCVSPPTDAAAALAGPDAAALLCDESSGACNFEATLTPEGRQANELSIAVNPTDPLNLIATGKDYTPEEAGDCVWAGVYSTKDGGRTWTNQNVPGSPWKLQADPLAPRTPFTQYWCVTDPVVAFGPDGTAYWTVMPYQCDPASGSKLGEGVIPNGGLNDWLWTCSSMWVLVSEDGGETWPIELAREVAAGARLAHDRQWIAAAPDGKTVLLCWAYGGPAATTPDEPRGPTDNGAVCSVSRDRGNSWNAFERASARGSSPLLEYDGTGRAWLSLSSSGDILVLSSEDGVEWSEPAVAATFKNSDLRNQYGRPVLRGSEARVPGYGAIAIDRSGGAYDGRIYVVYFDHAAGQADVFLVWSDDGKAWSEPLRVHDDGESANDQWMPSVSVGPDGAVDVSWWDRRDDPENYLFHMYYAYSLDGGVTMSKNLRVSEVASDEAKSHHQNGMIFLGDYLDIDSSHGQGHLVWVDTRHGMADVFVANVARPGANA